MFSNIFGSSKEAKLMPLYQVQNGWMVFNTRQLNPAQSEVVDAACRSEARYQRLQALAKGATAVLGAAALVIATLVLAKIAAPFFALCVGKWAVFANVQLHEMTPFIVKGLTKAGIYLGGAFGLKKLWGKTHPTVQNHLNYATHLDREALKALLHRAGQMVLIRK